MQSPVVQRLSPRIEHAIPQASTPPGSTEFRPTSTQNVSFPRARCQRDHSCVQPLSAGLSNTAIGSHFARGESGRSTGPCDPVPKKKRPDWRGRCFYRLNLENSCRSNGIRQTVEQSRPEHPGILVDKTNDGVEICHYDALFLRRPLHIPLNPSGPGGHLNLELQCLENSSL